MTHEIKQNEESILFGESDILITIVFNNITGINYENHTKYQQYIKSVAIALLGLKYGRVELWENGLLKKIGYITHTLLK